MGAPTIGGTTTGAVTENSGIVITGDLDDVGWGTGNSDDTWSISSPATYGTATINPTTGTWSYDLDDSNPVVHALDPGDTLTDVFTVYMLDSDGRSDTQQITITISGAVCFAAGTLIETIDGPCPVEELQPGARLRTRDDGWQPLLWVGSQDVSPADLARNDRLRPVRIAAGALGRNLPERDLLVSRQHRVLIAGPQVARMFGHDEMLVAVAKLIGLPGIDIDPDVTAVEYFHLLFDRHQIVHANDAPCESLLPGPQAMELLPARAREAVVAALARAADGRTPPLDYPAARPIIHSGKRLRRLCGWLEQSGDSLIAARRAQGAAA